MALRNLLREKIITYYINDRGRQKVRRYVTLEYRKEDSKQDLSGDEEIESDIEFEEEMSLEVSFYRQYVSANLKCNSILPFTTQ